MKMWTSLNNVNHAGDKQAKMKIRGLADGSVLVFLNVLPRAPLSSPSRQALPKRQVLWGQAGAGLTRSPRPDLRGRFRPSTP